MKMLQDKNKIRIEGAIAYIALPCGDWAIIDVDDLGQIANYNWHAVDMGHTKYVRRNRTKNDPPRPLSIRLHRQLMSAPNGMDVDHVNMNGLDNRKSNLRVCTRSQNLCNRKVQARTKSKLKGVVWHKRAQKWMASLKYEGKHYYLGLFRLKEDAHLAYLQKSKEIHKDFGRA
jgi:hypothetical protein